MYYGFSNNKETESETLLGGKLNTLYQHTNCIEEKTQLFDRA